MALPIHRCGRPYDVRLSMSTCDPCNVVLPYFEHQKLWRKLERDAKELGKTTEAYILQLEVDLMCRRYRSRGATEEEIEWLRAKYGSKE